MGQPAHRLQAPNTPAERDLIAPRVEAFRDENLPEGARDTVIFDLPVHKPDQEVPVIEQLLKGTSRDRPTPDGSGNVY